MKKKEVVLGKVYLAKISGRMAPVKITRESPFGGWGGENLTTGFKVRIHGAQKLRCELEKNPESGKWRPVKQKTPENVRTQRMLYSAMVQMMEEDFKMFGVFSISCDMFSSILREKYNDAEAIPFESLCLRFADDHKCDWEKWDKSCRYVAFRRNQKVAAA